MEIEANTEELDKKKTQNNKNHNSTKNRYLSCVCYHGTDSCSNYIAFYPLHRYKLESHFNRVIQGKDFREDCSSVRALGSLVTGNAI